MRRVFTTCHGTHVCVRVCRPMQGREREIIYLPLHCHHQNDFSALRWAAMRAILIFHNCEGQSDKTEVHRAQHLRGGGGGRSSGEWG